MALPKLDTPTYEVTLPSTGEPIKFRPFLVKEQKVLMMAQESKDTKQMITTMGNLVKSCCIETVDIDKIPMFDIEYLFLNIRGKSVGEEIEVNIICPDDGETQVPVMINIDDIQVQKDDEHTNKIQLDEQIMMVMKYPSLDQFIKNNFDFESKNQMDQSFDLIASCIESICTEEDVWATADCTKKEVTEFLESMNSSQFKGVEKFFDTMPKLAHTIKVKNPVTKKESEVVLEGLASFFA